MDNFAAMFSLEAEQSLIGALMLSESAWDDAGELVGPADFVRQEHRVLFSAIARLAEQSKQRDGLTVAEKLLEFNELDEAGGKAYIGELIKNTPRQCERQSLRRDCSGSRPASPPDDRLQAR
jgi:replicative DNA helicase